MSFKTLREKHLLSQEKLSEMSGLGLRTIQRLEAGHRVSYVSLRALALAMKMDVDVLERALYAMETATEEDYVEMPRWVRRLCDGLSTGSPALACRQAHVYEGLAIGLGVIFLLTALVTPAGLATATMLAAGLFALMVGYGMSVATRVVDRYRGWSPDARDATTTTSATRPLPRFALYAMAIVLPALLLWLVVRFAG